MDLLPEQRGDAGLRAGPSVPEREKAQKIALNLDESMI